MARRAGGLAGWCALAAWAGAAGCSLPSPSPDFSSISPEERIEALQQAAADGDRSAIPGLIGLLDSDDPAERMLANAALRRLTNRDFGYDFAAPERERSAAADRWQAWFEAGGDRNAAAENPAKQADAAGSGPASSTDTEWVGRPPR